MFNSNFSIKIKKQLYLFLITYLKLLAKVQQLKHQSTIIGVTGTSGKTSTLHALEATLQDFFSLKVSHKANSESGLPIDILGLSISSFSWKSWLKIILLAPWQLILYWPKHQLYIAEMAIDSPHSPKNMSYLLSIIKPHVGIFLNADTTHSETFDHLAVSTNPKQRREEIARLIANEKGKIIQSLPKNGCAILNIDDCNVFSFREKTLVKTISFGKNKNATVKFVEHQPSLAGTIFIFEIEGKRYSTHFKKMALPNHYGYTFCSALSCALFLKIPINKAIWALEKNFHLPTGRATLLESINQSYILDSSYNSSLKPLLDSLKLLNQVAPKRRVALLGDMRELGEQSATDHQEAARAIIKNCDLAVLVGPQMKQHTLPILKKTKLDCCWFASAIKAADYLKKALKKDDLLLVKSSQNTLLLEIAIEQLLANPKQDKKLLCRRGEYWNRKRKQFNKFVNNANDN